MAISAGKLSRRVRFERLQAGVNDYNEETGAWVAIGDRWCWPSFGTGQERREAAQEGATSAATFRLRRTPFIRGITPKDRLRFNPMSVVLDEAPVWDIVSIVPADDDAIDIAAVRRA